MAHRRGKVRPEQVEEGGQAGVPCSTVGSTQGKVSEINAPPKKLLECGREKGVVQGATQRGPDSWRLRPRAGLGQADLRRPWASSERGPQSAQDFGAQGHMA